MTIEAKDKEEAQKKFEKFDSIKDYESQCIHEELIDVYCDVDENETTETL